MKLLNRTPVEPVKPKTTAQLAKEADILREEAIKDARARIELEKIEAEAAFAKEIDDALRARQRQARQAKDKVAKKKIDSAKYRAIVNRLVPYAPLVGVNVAAITGQIGWALAHLEIGESGTPLRWFAAILFGSIAESIALFLQFYANRAILNRDAAGALYLAAFMVAGLVAAVNYSHWSKPTGTDFFGEPNATAVVFALFSFISPWLWRIHNRAEFRETLRAAGEIDPRGVKLSAVRKIMYPVRSFGVVRLAAWYGETNPVRAVEMYETRRVARETVKAAEKAAKLHAKENKAVAPATPETPSEAAPKAVSSTANGTGRDMTQHAKWNTGVAEYTASLDAGSPMNTRQLAAALGQRNKVLASAIIRHVKTERGLI